ncbi:MAG: HNH endonuclease [Parvularculaceae bacterium]|nr:HNH endonuclease [Parvularculaceae bacterium]
MPKKLTNIGARLVALRPRLAPTKRADDLYASAEWRRLAAKLKAERGGACARCGSSDRVVADHVREVKDGGAALDAANLQLLCHACHQSKTAAARTTRGG